MDNEDRELQQYEAPEVELVMDRDELGREILHAVVNVSDPA